MVVVAVVIKQISQEVGRGVCVYSYGSAHFVVPPAQALISPQTFFFHSGSLSLRPWRVVSFFEAVTSFVGLGEAGEG